MKIQDILREFAPDSGSDGGGDDGFSEETLKKFAAQWYNGDEDPRVEKILMAAGWEIGQDEGYDDEPGVFVVQAGDVNGHSFISWPANELRQGVAEGDKMSRINLDQSLANTPPAWKKFIRSLPPQLAREFVDERPRPDQDDIDFLTPLRLVISQPVAVRVGDLLRHPENQATIGRSPDDVVAAVNQRWGLKVPSGKKYDPNPARYRAYAQMEPGTASPSVMADGVILFGAGRFVAAALRGDETMRVWSMTRKQDVAEGSKP